MPASLETWKKRAKMYAGKNALLRVKNTRLESLVRELRKKEKDYIREIRDFKYKDDF